MTNARRGDVVWVGFPTRDVRGWKRMPAVLLKEPEVAARFGNALLVPISSRTDLGGPTRILVRAGMLEAKEMGLVEDSRIFIDEVGGVPSAWVGQRVGRCPFIREIDGVLKALLRFLTA
jgi:mRNA-degrading endonuclease toxin of MazEF toxin-antitoxin module